jgi:predicted transposase/invertase (TIGR01784 family)
MDELRPKDPHDRFFKTIMADENNVRLFVKEFLPHDISKEITLEKMKLLPTEKLRRYRKYHMDLAVECEIGQKKGQLYFIFEHKSYPNRKVLLQILGYMYALWDEQERTSKPLTPIIPVVIYHGMHPWNIPTAFLSQFEGLKEPIKRYMPEFEYALVDLTTLSDEEIRKRAKDNAFLAESLRVMKYAPVQNIERIKATAGIIISPEQKMIIIEYLFQVLDVEEEAMYEIAQKIGGEEVMPSLAEKLEKRGEKRGELKGKEIGKIEAKRSTLIRQLKRKFGLTPAEEEKVRSVTDEAKLETALDAILDAKDKSEVLRTLG